MVNVANAGIAACRTVASHTARPDIISSVYLDANVIENSHDTISTMPGVFHYEAA